ncbi:MAG: SpaH/EbpB family LPXTG-anchored major pilin, partial [Anaerovoracaceae bacterium]
MRKQRLSTRIGAIMVAMTLAVGTFAMSGLSVFAAPPSSEGVKSITIHKYVMEDIRGATIPGSGSAEDVANVPADARPLANVGFKIYKVSPDENDLYPEGKNFTLHKDADGTVDGITENGKLYSAVQEKEELFTDEQGIAKMSELVTGVYLIVEQDSVDPVTGKLLNVVKAAPFLVNAPMTSPDGTNTINDIHVFPKNQATAPTKTPVGGSSVAVGEIKTWKIKMNVPAGMAASQALVITDKLDEALTYQDN